jgi:protein TonB
MAYADQQMSGNRVIAIIIVALIHVAVGYALITGLAYSAAKKLVERVTTVDIEEPPPPKDEPPPPPPKDTAPPPPVDPPPPISIAPAPPPIQTQPTIPPPMPPALRVPPPAPVAAPPPPPPPPRFSPKSPEPRGNPGSWANSNDYPSRALREEKEGVTRFTVQVDSSGRVSSCSVTGSSGTPELDSTTCSLITRRARFKPATDGNGNPTTGSWSSAVRWEIPK